jgi:hypothetical protein
MCSAYITFLYATHTNAFIEFINVAVFYEQRSSVFYWSEFLASDPEVRVLFPALPDFLRSSGSGTGSTQPREYN